MDFASLKTIQTSQELESLGTLEEIKESVEHEVAPLKVCASSWAELYSVIVALQSHWDSFQRDPYFKSENSRYICALVYMDTTARNKVIGLNPSLYDDMEQAKKWYRAVAEKVHPDHNPDNQTDAATAFNELKSIYKRMQWAAEDSPKEEEA